MTLKACPQCGYPYNAPENQTCGKCGGWLGGTPQGGPAVAVGAAPSRRGGLLPRSPRELVCYLPIPVGALLGWPNPIGAAFGLLMSALILRVVRLEMERFSKGLLVGIVVAAVFFGYLIFLLVFDFLYGLIEPPLQQLVGGLLHR